MKNEPGPKARPAGLPARRCSRCGRVLTDSGSIEVPLSNIVVNFFCSTCQQARSSRLAKNQVVQEAFGKCHRCGEQMQAINAGLDFDKVISLLKDKGEVKIIWDSVIKAKGKIQ